jgi:hypothetical protein
MPYGEKLYIPKSSALEVRQAGLGGYQRLKEIVMKVALTCCETSDGILGS